MKKLLMPLLLSFTINSYAQDNFNGHIRPMPVLCGDAIQLMAELKESTTEKPALSWTTPDREVIFLMTLDEQGNSTLISSSSKEPTIACIVTYGENLRINIESFGVNLVNPSSM